MKSKQVIVIVIALAILLAGCSSGTSDSSSLEGIRWHLVALEGEQPLAGTAPPSAEFSEGQINGSTGCNHFFGGYEVSGSDMTISDVASTEMACLDPEGLMDQEQAFLSALAAVAGYNLAGERLELLDAGGSVLLAFEPAPAAPE